MARYIDADAVKGKLNEIARHSFTLDDDYQYFIKGLIRADDAINEIPTADVVEVVRCRECIHWDTDWEPLPGFHYCPMVDGLKNGEWFCADGERRTDDAKVH